MNEPSSNFMKSDDLQPGQNTSVSKNGLKASIFPTCRVCGDLTFSGYIAGQNDSFLIEAAKAIVNKTTDIADINPLFIHGDIGMGKTHLLCAMVNATDRHNPIYLHTPDLESAINQIDTQGNNRAKIREILTSSGILLIDDLQFCGYKTPIQQEIMMVMDQMIQAKKPCVLSSNLAIHKLRGLNPQLRSRLSAGITAKIGASNPEVRLQIIRLQPFHSVLPPDVLNFLAERITSDTRKLISAGKQLAALHRFGRRQIDIALATELLEDLTRLDPSDSHPSGDKNEINPDISIQDTAQKIEKAARFKKMFEGAETEEEQALALQIALSERLRQLRQEQSNPQTIEKLEHALSLLRDGEVQQALNCMDQCF